MYCKHGNGNPGCVPCAIEAQTQTLKKEMEGIRKEISSNQCSACLFARISRWFYIISHKNAAQQAHAGDATSEAVNQETDALVGNGRNL